MLSRGIENAQRRIENRNFDIRKNLLEYDDVANDQRQAIYSLRNQLLEESDISETIDELIDEQFKSVVYDFIPIDSVESQWELKELEEYLLNNFGINTDIENIVEKDKTLLPETIADIVKDNANNFFQEKYSNIADTRLLLEKQVMLQVLDVHWKEHLAEIDHLRQSIGLRAYAQKNPKNEYKREAYAMFEEMLDQINKETIRVLFTLQLTSPDEITNVKDSSQDELELRKDDFNKENINEVNESKLDNIPITREEPKFGRNEVVKITNGIDTKEMKYKKAKLLIETGEWKVI